MRPATGSSRSGARRERRLRLGLIASALPWLVVLAAPAAWGQEERAAPIDPAPPEIQAAPELPPPSQIEAIEVTGERMDTTNVQDEAQAVTAFDMGELDRANITSVDALGNNVPNLHVGNQGNQAIVTLRAVGTQNATITGEPGVQFHVDGINYARPAAARVAFFDLEGLRVVRGPHGTNGGKNATGGAIHVMTRKPVDEWQVEGDYQIGSYDEKRSRGAINIPLLPERLAGRFAFIQEERTGYQINLLVPEKEFRADDADNLGLRAHLRFNPSDTFEGLLSYNYYRARGVGPGAKLVGDPHEVACLTPLREYTSFRQQKASQRPRALPVGNFFDIFDAQGAFAGEQINFSDGSRYVRRILNDRPRVTRHTKAAYCADVNSTYISDSPPSPDPRDPRKVYLDRTQEQSNDIWGWAGTFHWDLPELPLLGETRLTSLTGFENTSLSDPRDFDTTDLPFFSLTTVENESQQYSSELKLESADGDWLDWTGGLYYQREKSSLLINGLTFGAAFGIGIDQDVTVKSYGAYGELKFHLSDALTLTTGARLTTDYKYTWLYRSNGSIFGQGGASADKTCLHPTIQGEYQTTLPAGTLLRDNVPDCSDRWKRWTGGIALEWRPLDNHLLYVQYDKGYKAGGYIVADFGKFDPELIDAFTLGSKSQFLDGRLELNLEGFYYLYEDYQVVEINGLSLRTENAPEARVFGLETEFDAELLPGLRLNGQAAYLNSEFTEFYSVDPMRAADAYFFSIGELPRANWEDLSGNQLARAPKWSYTVGLEYELPIGRWGSLTPRWQYYWQDETYYRAYNSDVDHQDSYHKTDLKLIWASPEQMFTAEAFVENIEDEDVYQNLVIGSSAIGSPALAYYSPPRLYGFRLGFRY